MANNWIVRFEMAEDFRHKQLVGEVPPAALQWLSSHWELLPRDGWVTRGSLRGSEALQTAWLSEEEQLVLSHENGEKQLLPQTVTREEEVSL
jgi:hypothetical protein